MILQDWFEHSPLQMIQALGGLGAMEQEFYSQSLRNIAIVGTSKADELLAELLHRRLCRSQRNRANAFHERMTFEMKIRFCAGIGLIDDDMANVLHFLRKTRNAFAHEPHRFDPDHNQLNTIHKKLQEEYLYMTLNASAHNNTILESDAERTFVSVLLYVTTLLSYYADSVERIVISPSTLRFKSTTSTCRISEGAGVSLITPINLPEHPPDPDFLEKLKAMVDRKSEE